MMATRFDYLARGGHSERWTESGCRGMFIKAILATYDTEKFWKEANVGFIMHPQYTRDRMHVSKDSIATTTK